MINEFENWFNRRYELGKNGKVYQGHNKVRDEKVLAAWDDFTLGTDLPHVTKEELLGWIAEQKGLDGESGENKKFIFNTEKLRLKERIAELEEERRWRKCSEDMPSADEGYFIALWEDKIPDIGYIGTEDDVIETIRDRGEGHSVEWWMPLPSAPKEEK